MIIGYSSHSDLESLLARILLFQARDSRLMARPFIQIFYYRWALHGRPGARETGEERAVACVRRRQSWCNRAAAAGRSSAVAPSAASVAGPSVRARVTQPPDPAPARTAAAAVAHALFIYFFIRRRRRRKHFHSASRTAAPGRRIGVTITRAHHVFGPPHASGPSAGVRRSVSGLEARARTPVIQIIDDGFVFVLPFGRLVGCFRKRRPGNIRRVANTVRTNRPSLNRIQHVF